MNESPAISEEQKKSIEQFLSWFINHCTGYEKGEGQIFFDRLFQAFGHKGVLEAGAKCEKPIKKRDKKGTAFSDLFWGTRVIIELKKRGENLRKHYDQAYDYWESIQPHKPKYMVLCNFDEFWVYDLNIQLNDPVHKLKTKNLLKEFDALSFLLESYIDPRFNNNNVEVTERVAKIVGSLFLSLEERGVEPLRAQRFVLQLVVALYAEDVNLIPKNSLLDILKEAVDEPITQNELQALFTAMAIESKGDKPQKYRDIDYFNGGIFRTVDPVELNFNEIDLLYKAAKQDWAKVRPSIFGAIFEGSMDPERRHGHGIHFTSEHDIQKIIGPTILKPFKKKIESSKTKKGLKGVLREICQFRVLDPACGSGNFLYVAFRELRRLEAEILEDLGEDPNQIRISEVSPNNFFGIDTNTFALELAKVALSIGRKISGDELGVSDKVLPFQDLDENFCNEDALLGATWPDVDAIIGNPPFQSKNKMLNEFGQEYVNEVREAYPHISGYADYCVYWFRKAHDHLKENQRAGLVGTNTIRQNESRESGLGYITQNNGTITDAVSSQVWSGDAVVHVSIVNWIKGETKGKKRLAFQDGDNKDSSWLIKEVEKIPSNLSFNTDVTSATNLKTIKKANKCFQGQNHGHEGFLLSVEEANSWLLEDCNYSEVVHPFLTGDDLLGKSHGPSRYVIDFELFGVTAAAKFSKPFDQVESKVLPWREEKAKEEEEKNRKTREKNPKAKIDKQYQNQLNKWWKQTRGREDMLKAISGSKRYIACCRVTKRPVFEFISSQVRPNGSLQVFALEDDYSFGILQSDVHWIWFTERCSTLKRDFRYTSDTVFDSFPWPQDIEENLVYEIAEAGRKIREIRNSLLADGKLTLRSLYKLMEKPGSSELKKAHKNLDALVRLAYSISSKDDVLAKLLYENQKLAVLEANSEDFVLPGLPPCAIGQDRVQSIDCIDLKVD